MNISELSLHDAVLSAAYVSWEAERFDLRVHPVGGVPHLLVFEGFTSLELPYQKPWGPSCSINIVREAKQGEFEIELQSGDVLCIKASHFSFRPESATNAL